MSGAQHVWVSLKSTALPRASAHGSRCTASPTAPKVPVHAPVALGPVGGEVALIGVTLVIFDPLPIVDQLGDITAEVDALDGRVGRAKLRVRVEWGPTTAKPRRTLMTMRTACGTLEAALRRRR